MGPILRASCDNCNQAKVKCSKQNPQCQRCKKHNTECIYGISLRAGKRSSQIALPKKSPTAPPLPADWNMNFSSASQYSTMDMELMPSIFEHDMPLSLEGYQCNSFLTDDGFPPVPDLSFDRIVVHTNSATNASTTSNHSPVMSDSVPSFSNSMLRPSLTQNIPSSILASCNCFRTIILTLSTLQQLSESLQASFDVAIVHNKEAVALCLSTLNCSCASDSTVVLLVASLLAKIISIYQWPWGAWANVQQRKMSLDSKVITARFMLGAYDVDEGEEERLRVELVGMELRKVETVISHLREHLERTTSEPEAQVHDSLEAFLSGNLLYTFEQKNGLQSAAVF